ncbi:MAG TPA: hypothetical protein VGC41_28965, partial [Kofleriaceae bacterium]
MFYSVTDVTLRELPAWDGPLAILFEGGEGSSTRPSLHLQAARGGYLRLVGGEDVLLWGRVDREWYDVELVRGAVPKILPPLRADDEHDRDGWTRRFAALLLAAEVTPLARGRTAMLSRSDARLGSLDALRAQVDLEWDIGSAATVLLRPLSAPDDGRVHMYRKLVRRDALPPVVTWWCKGLFAYVVLDGHDRLQAALLEGKQPPLLVLEDLVKLPATEIDQRKAQTLRDAELVDAMPWVSGRANAMNLMLRSAWDPRNEWRRATPGFPLDQELWEREVRGTKL